MAKKRLIEIDNKSKTKMTLKTVHLTNRQIAFAEVVVEMGYFPNLSELYRTAISNESNKECYLQPEILHRIDEKVVQMEKDQQELILTEDQPLEIGNKRVTLKGEKIRTIDKVFSLFQSGQSAIEIAIRLGVTEGTVRNYIYQKNMEIKEKQLQQFKTDLISGEV